METAKTVILVVDDERAVEELVESFVQRAGYAHASFNDPIEALRYFKAHKEHICLAVIDLTMQKLSGPQLVKEIFDLAPSVPVVIITGQLENRIPDDIASRLHRVVQKPFTKSELLEAVESTRTCVRTDEKEVTADTP